MTISELRTSEILNNKKRRMSHPLEENPNILIGGKASNQRFLFILSLKG
jgi:hypothetical protein